MSEFDPRRPGLITGSKCSILHPKRSAEAGQKTYAKQLANEMYFRFSDERDTWQTKHGKDFEAEAYVYLRERFDKSAIEKPDFFCRDSFGGTPDCLCDDYGVDFKCPTSLEKWLDYLHLGIDNDQYHQCQMYMMLCGKEQWKICAYLTETFKMTDDGIKYPVHQDKRMIQIVVDKDPAWEALTYTNAIPVIEARDFYYNKLIETFGPIKQQDGTN